MKDLISIVVPIYNAQDTLERCLLSIKEQTYKNFEVILVDDGSIDNSKVICKKIIKNDDRFKYFYKINEGVAKTRNFGLKLCKGQYITFIDSDDYVSIYYIEKLYKGLISNDCDISVCLAQNVYKEIYQDFKINSKLQYNILSAEQALEFMLLEKDIDTSFWGKMYKKNLFDKIIIKDYKIFEDLDTMYKIILKANKIILIKEKLYFYYIRKGSLSHINFSEKNLVVLKILDNMEREIIKKYPSLSDAILCRKINANFYILRNTQKKSKYYNICKKYIKCHRKYVLKIKNISLKSKIGIIVSFISFDLIKPIFKLNECIKYLVTNKGVS